MGDRLTARIEEQIRLIERDLASNDAGKRADAIKRAESLTTEVLEYLAGAAASYSGLASPVHGVALLWVDKLSTDLVLPPVGLVVPSAREFLGTLAQVIRLRVPDDGIWGLPVAVHEYGHFVATELRYRRIGDDDLPVAEALVEDRLRELSPDNPLRFRLGHEIFADLFATYVAGPSYLHYCIRHRFEPAREPEPGHPQARRRVAASLSMLDAMATRPGGDSLVPIAEYLRTQWSEACSVVGLATEPAEDELGIFVEELSGVVLNDAKLAYVAYKTHLPARMLGERLRRNEAVYGPVAVVLNAAWSARVSAEASLSGVGLTNRL
ncbi:MAG: hypothetical protein LC733_05535, partial [Actinobacteria bacterium]|nr:hypothetical protein [Actinomycetota bacterium]